MSSVSVAADVADDATIQLFTHDYVKAYDWEKSIHADLINGMKSATDSLKSTYRDTPSPNSMPAKSALTGGLAFINFMQTYQNLYHDNGYELNPVLGPHPPKMKFMASVLISSSVIYGVSYVLPKPWDGIFLDSVNSSMLINIEWDQLMTDQKVIRPTAMPVVLTFRF